jgi:hypothetical protein
MTVCENPTEVSLPLKPPCAWPLGRDHDRCDPTFPEYLPHRRHVAHAEPDQGSVGRDHGGECIAGDLRHVGQVQLGLDDVQFLLPLLQPIADCLPSLDLVE